MWVKCDCHHNLKENCGSVEFLPKSPWKSPECNTRSNFSLWCDLKASIIETLASVQELKQETSSLQSAPAVLWTCSVLKRTPRPWNTCVAFLELFYYLCPTCLEIHFKNTLPFISSAYISFRTTSTVSHSSGWLCFTFLMPGADPVDISVSSSSEWITSFSFLLLLFFFKSRTLSISWGFYKTSLSSEVLGWHPQSSK